MEKDRAGVEGELIRLRKAVETSGEVIFLTDRDGIITSINPEFTKVYGYTAEEVVGKTTPRILKSGEMALQYYEQLWGKLLSNEIVRSEVVNKCKDGRLISIESSANPVLDDQGTIVGFLAIQRDVTERKRADDELKQRNKELAALNAVSAIVSQSLDLNQILYSVLDEVLRLNILGKKMYGMLFLLDENRQTLVLAAQRGAPDGHPCLTDPVKVGECLCGMAVQQGEVFVSRNSLEDIRHTRHWPHMFAHRDICIPIRARGITLGCMEIRLPGSYAVADSDINLLQAVADQIGVAIENAQLRELRERAITEERQRIANELHDGFSQLLGYVNTKVMAVRLLVHKQQIKAVDEHLSQLEAAAREGFVDVREAILGLKMASQSSAGLSINLKEYITHFSRLSELPATLTIAPEIEDVHLKPETEYQLMRIVQEALNNVRKHASARQVWVSVQFTDNVLEVSIIDDGIGFDSQAMQADPKGHLGLNTMRERAQSIGADLSIDSAPEQGTCIRARLARNRGIIQ